MSNANASLLWKVLKLLWEAWGERPPPSKWDVNDKIRRSRR